MERRADPDGGERVHSNRDVIDNEHDIRTLPFDGYKIISSARVLR
jgi:hypothetical protein